MALYYGSHKVNDYDTWRPYFDADDAARTSIGAKCVSVMRSTEDSNKISLVFDIADVSAFVDFIKAPERGEVMQKAGVLEKPLFYKLEEIAY